MTKSTKYYFDVWNNAKCSSTVLDAVFDKLDAEDLYYVDDPEEFDEHVEVYRERCNMWIRQLIQIRDALDFLEMEEKDHDQL